MSISQAIVALVEAVAEENAKLNSLANEGTYIGSVTLKETVAREHAELDLENALDRFVAQMIADKTGAC